MRGVRVVYLGVGRQDGVDRRVWPRSTDAAESAVEGHHPGSARDRRWARCRSVVGQGSLARPGVLHQFYGIKRTATNYNATEKINSSAGYSKSRKK